MSEDTDLIDSQGVRRLADESGLAIAIVGAEPRELAVFNNNSICRSLNPTGEFSPACSQFCGRAFEKAFEVGKTVGFECHAGLACRAVPMRNAAKPFVAIVGRTFVKAENYRMATTRAVSGDWHEMPPSELFENILLTGSEAVLDKAAERLEHMPAAKPEESKIEETPPAATEEKIEPREKITTLVERFNREMGLKTTPVHPDPEPRVEQTPPPQRVERRTAEAQAWRAFFGSLLKNDFAKATDSILEFLAGHFGFSALAWLEKQDNRLVNVAAFGDLKNRKIRLAIASDDHRLLEAFDNERPLELGERAKGTNPARTMNLFPIGVGDEIAAAIAVLDPIEDESIKTQIARIGHSLAPQLEILRLRSEVARTESLASAVRRFSANLKRIDADDLWLNLTQNAAEMLRAERASLLVFDEEADKLKLKALIGAKSEPAADEETGTRVSRIVFARNEAVVVTDVATSGLPPAPDDRQYRTPSFLSCPINIGGRKIGVMNFTDRASGEAFDKSSLELFQELAPQLAVAIDRASLKEKAGEFEQLSVTDSLTGLLNRRYIEARLSEEVKRSNRHGFPMSFMMLDVDHFKSYNDSFGHPAGDEALKIVGSVIRDTLRGADVAARFGGEEFSILLPQTNSEEAAAIGERIRANIERARFPHRAVTVSIGIASCSADLCASAELVDAADRALYEAKHRGRNQVLAFEQLKQNTSNHQPA